jgi:hypothetical protein
MISWRPCPDEMIRALQRERFSRAHQASEAEAWLLAWLAHVDGVPFSRRVAAETFGWGTTRAASLLENVAEAFKSDPKRWNAPQTRHQERTQTRQPTGVEPEQSEDTAPVSRHKRATNAPPSRARVHAETETEKDTKTDPRTPPERTAPLFPSPVEPSKPPRTPKPPKPDKPPEDPRLRRVTDLWVQVATEQGLTDDCGRVPLRMGAGKNGADRLARPAVVQVAGLPAHDGVDRWDLAERVMRAGIRMRLKRDRALFPTDGTPTFERLAKDWPVIVRKLHEEPRLGQPGQPEPGDFDEDAPF